MVLELLRFQDFYGYDKQDLVINILLITDYWDISVVVSNAVMRAVLSLVMHVALLIGDHSIWANWAFLGREVIL